ncbi:MAG TPA: endolytic transglycosylase MltG [Deltaproteobacteria bacterium]|jgi:UPF0755 protein|nr:endolytic transglycosylase MltG [Deltaproteobacteria bacterium]HOI07733.1 endolytic transglycosylase MltG [Deltaproteobacteria bacterium]
MKKKPIYKPFMKKLSNGVMILLVCVLVIVVTHTYIFIITPKTPPKPLMIDIKPGTSAWQISRELEEQGIITDKTMFMALAVITGKVKRLQAGSYVFEGRHYPFDIISILFKGRTLKYRITIPEGSTIYDVGAIVAETGLLSKADFVRIASSEDTTEFFGIDAPTMEGFLYPDTYYLAPHMTSLEVMAKMVSRFNDICPKDIKARCEELGMSLPEVITLASIIQKEAVNPSEKPVIASVFHNRLKQNMPLQSDPTAVYGIDGFRRKIMPEDLRRDSPYNTYRVQGLPPGPICSPDKMSIQAALWPARTSYLFFVSQGNGRHYFSRTYQEHNHAIRRSNGASR